MRPDDPGEQQVGSFQEAISALTVDPDVGALVSVCYNEQYTPFILGCLLQGLQRVAWADTDEAVALQAQERINQLMYLFQQECAPMTTGIIQFFPGTSAPLGWLPCDGAAVSRDDFAALFTLLGTTYGAGDGSTTFNVPDLRGRTPIGSGQQSGGSNFVVAVTGGEETHTLTETELASHDHSWAGYFEAVAVSPGELPVLIPPVLPSVTGLAGGGGAHNNLQPYLVLLPIIKT